MATAVFGCGYWGSKIVRILRDDLAVICDLRQEVLEPLGKEFNHIPKVTSVEQVWEMPTVRRVVIATPTDTHFSLAKEALAHGLDVFVEKPVTTSSADAQTLHEMATASGRVLMVGHVTNYHSEAELFCDWIREEKFGRLRKIQAQRFGCAFLRPDVDAMWNCGIHDVSLSLRFMREGGYTLDKASVKAIHSKSRGRQPDTVFTSATFVDRDGTEAILDIHADCHHVKRQRSMQLIFENALVSWDATKPTGEKDSIKISQYDAASGDRVTIRDAEVDVPTLPISAMPLNRELSHFLGCCKKRTIPLTNGAEGVEVVKFLELISRSK